MRREIDSQVWKAIEATGGATVSLDGVTPTTGYAVSTYPTRGWVVPVHCADAQVVRQWISTNLEWLGRENHYIGAWVDDGLLHLDVSVVIPDREHALAVGRARDQRAIWDLKNAQEILCHES